MKINMKARSELEKSEQSGARRKKMERGEREGEGEREKKGGRKAWR